MVLHPHNPRQNTSGTNAQPTCREEIRIILIGTNPCYFHILLLYSFRQQLYPVGFPKVEVPLFISAGDASHIKPCCFKGFIHLISHFKSIQRDTRPNISLHIFSLRAHKVPPSCPTSFPRCASLFPAIRHVSPQLLSAGYHSKAPGYNPQ